MDSQARHERADHQPVAGLDGRLCANAASVFSLPAAPGTRFCIYHPPANAAGSRGGFVYVHPFGEEMNKTRALAARQSRRLAAAGFAVLQFDLLGCGDSSGDFGDARWELWRQDVQAAIAWLRERVRGPIGLWGVRLGAVLAADVARDPGMGIEQLLLWQPVASGEQFLKQFLRLHLAAEMLSSGSAQTGVAELQTMLERGQSLEIAGYTLHPQLASAIAKLRLADMIPAVKRVCWLEVSVQAEPAVSPASLRTQAAWRARNLDVLSAAVHGESFWSTSEIAECAALHDASEALLAVGRAPAPRSQRDIATSCARVPDTAAESHEHN